MTKLPTLYSRTTTGQIQEWTIVVDGDCFYTVEGIQGGKLTTSTPTICKGKNLGRANETSPREQAAKEAAAKWQKKIEKGYFGEVDDIDNETYFKPMLAHKYLEHTSYVKFPWLGQIKLDGIRAVATKKGIASRTGKPIVSIPHIAEALAGLFEEHPNWVVDGEAYSHDVTFEAITSLVRTTVNLTPEVLKESAETIKYYIYDCVIDDPNADYTTRWETFKKEFKRLKLDTEVLDLVMTVQVNDDGDIERWHKEFVDLGYEGLILRNPSAPYQHKRTTDLLKYKHFFDAEYTIKDITEGVGNRSGMMGRILCVDKKGVEFEANAKGTQKYYRKLWREKKEFIGKIATIRYQELTERGVPRFGVMHSVRDYE